VLLVDDDAGVRRAYMRALGRHGYHVQDAASGEAAAALLDTGGFDVVVADVHMPGCGGVGLLRGARAAGLRVPFVLMTGGVEFDHAVAALENGALRLLLKPVPTLALLQAVDGAVRARREIDEQRRAMAVLQLHEEALRIRVERRERFVRALDRIWIANQPIVSWRRREVHAYEALVRGAEQGLARPDQLLAEAEQLEMLPALSRAVRQRIAAQLAVTQTRHTQFVNLHPADLLDEELYDPAAPMTAFASRIVLEITERAHLESTGDLADRVRRLRALGYTIAVDDLGSGYAGLTALARIRPEVVKLDMSLVRGIDGNPTRRQVVESLRSLADHLGMEVVVEGVETVAERDVLSRIGCDMMQGYLFAQPAAGLPTVCWS
jgi:EAL domain-containing protein (putative c-di-GMP-specific phosphodiesterase class I)